MVKKNKKEKWEHDSSHPHTSKTKYNSIHTQIGRFCAEKLVKTRISPNQISFAGLIMNVINACLFFKGGTISLVIAAIGVHWAWILDGIDGKLARLRDESSSYGSWVDDVGGTYGWLFVALGITFGVYKQVQKPQVLVLGLMIAMCVLLKNLMQEHFFKNFKFSNEYGITLYKKFGILMFFRFGGLFNVTLISLGAVFNKLYWVLIFLGLYGPVYNLIQTTILTLKARKEYLKEKSKKFISKS